MSWRLLRYEKYLNKTDDVSFVVNHYLSQGFEVEETSNAAATSIMGYVRDRFCRQMSIFRTETLNLSKLKMPNKGKRKRGSSLPSRAANITSQAVTSQLSNDKAHVSHQEPNSWATCAFQVELSTVQAPIQQLGPLSPRNPHRNPPGCSYGQSFPYMTTMSTNSGRQKQPTPALGASQPQQNPGKSFHIRVSENKLN